MAMRLSSITGAFVYWFFATGPAGILKAWRNFLLWGADSFSLRLTLLTFFKPWRKIIHPRRSKGIDFKELFDVVVFTNFSRLIGMVVRSFILIIGGVFELVILFTGLIVFAGWFFLPVIIIFLLMLAL